MSEGILTIIWIGGQIEESSADILIDAINNANLFAHEGDTCFQPYYADDLEDALTPTGHLYLCDDSAVEGDMPEIKVACRELDLSYRLWHEASEDTKAEIEAWAPGIETAIRFTSDSGREVNRALELLEQGKDNEAAQVLNSFVPGTPPLPRFEVSESSKPDITDEVA